MTTCLPKHASTAAIGRQIYPPQALNVNVYACVKGAHAHMGGKGFGKPRHSYCCSTWLMVPWLPCKRTSLCQSCIVAPVTWQVGVKYCIQRGLSPAVLRWLQKRRTSEISAVQQRRSKGKSTNTVVKFRSSTLGILWVVSLMFAFWISYLRWILMQSSQRGDVQFNVTSFESMEAVHCCYLVDMTVSDQHELFWWAVRLWTWLFLRYMVIDWSTG